MSKVAQSSLLEWSRQPKESAKAHQAAREYFEIGAGRSLCAVAKKVQKSISLIERWSGKWSWVTRARAFDAHLACQEEQASELERNKRRATWLLRKEEHSERLFQLANKMEAKADKMLDLPLTTITQANGQTHIHGSKWKLADTAVLLKTAAELKARAIHNELGDAEDGMMKEEWIIEDYEDK